MDIGIGILAGGKSLRMGSDKSNLIYNGKSFLDNLLYEFRNYEIIVSSNKENINKNNVVYVKDMYKNIGPIGGILEILKNSVHKYNLIIPVDMQNINIEYLKYISNFISRDYDLFVVKNNGNINPLAGIYSKEMIPIIEKNISNYNYKLQNLINENYTKIIEFKYSKFTEDILYNINTVGDYRKLCRNNIVSICGSKNSGKTTFIKKVVKTLRKKGYTVSVIKHDGHNFTVPENTDTGKFFRAGANNVAIFSKNRYMLYKDSSISSEEIITEINDTDIVIIEGLKNENYDKFEIVRSANSNNIISSNKLIGIITDITNLKEKYEICFDIYEIDKFVDFLIEKYI